MNQSFIPVATGGLLAISVVFGAPQKPSELAITKSAVRECSRSFYQLGRDLMQVPHVELNDPKRFFELINERIDDQRAVIAMVRGNAKEEESMSALVAADKLLGDVRRALRGIEAKEDYGEAAFSAGSSLMNSTPFRDFFLKSLGNSKPMIREDIAGGGN